VSGSCWTLEPGSPEWPGGLPDLGSRAPERLHCLGAKSAAAGLEPDAAVTIVGSRRATAYGIEVATALARDLAAAGFVIVSGMANGVDAAAHRGALAAGGTTIAVLAGGPDVPYPPAQRGLYASILESSGAVVSERVPGERPERWGFPERNRIMAALGAMSILVEAAEPSGSRITADEALKLGRHVGAVPGPVTSRLSAGTNALLLDGADLVRDAQDVLDRLVGIGEPRAHVCGPPLEGELESVLCAVEGGAGTTDAICAGGGDARAVAVALVRLELLGYVRADPLGRYSRTTLRAPASS
jgi:DNA processing protein